ncbi:MAG: NAD-dependent epimerase/dehydratase family protein [Brevinema sp.]
MRILVSGGTGYVGSFLCPELQKQGYEVAVISRKNNSKYPTCIYNGDIKTLQSFFDQWKPDMVIHLAADTSKQTTSATLDTILSANIILPAHLLQVSSEHNVKTFLNISTFSTSVNGKDYYPQTYYAATKKAIEDLVTFYSYHTNMDVYTLGFYDIYGINQPHARFLNSCIEKIKKGETFHMSPGEQEICFLYVKDAIDAMIFSLTAEREAHQVHIYMVMGSEILQLKQVPHICAEALGLGQVDIIHDMPYRATEIMKVLPPAPKLPHWIPKYTLKKGLQDMLL